MADKFVLLRLVNMRGVDLNTFDFDYDLTWMGFFLDADGRVLTRYGGRDGADAEKYLSFAGLKHAMRAALEANRAGKTAHPAPAKEFAKAEEYAAAKRLKADACIHCHQVYEFRRDLLRTAGKWRQEETTWTMLYPLPLNIGLTVAPEQGSKVTAVREDSPAGKAGLRAGDVLITLGDRPTATFADIQYALHLAPSTGAVAATWQRAGKEMSGRIELPEGWRVVDISWRAFMWGLEPTPGVYGQDLSADEKKKLGLPEKALAFRMGNYVPTSSRRAGVQANDIILGLDDKRPELTMLQFNAHVRLNYKVGDRVTLNIIRNGKRMDLPMTLAARDGF